MTILQLATETELINMPVRQSIEFAAHSRIENDIFFLIR